MKTRCMLISFALGLGLALALLWVLAGATLAAAHAEGPALSVAEGPAPSMVEGSQRPAQRSLLQAGDVLTVCPAVAGTCSYTNVQAAVGAAHDGDVIKVAAGTYSGVNNYGGLAQVVYISKTVTIEGGYATTNWATPYPITQPTTLDALGQGRGLYITGDISPTVEGVRITGGHTAGDGGGVYIITATATISNNWVFSNTADFQGGGLYLSHSAATLSGNTVISNSTAAIGWAGGGLSLEYSAATLSGNIIRGNTASTSAGGYGGGLYLGYSPATLTSNAITSNTAHSGGGLFLWASDATISGNTVSYNTARDGGGLLVLDSTARLRDNTVSGNNAANVGGGLTLGLHSDPILSGNTVSSNTAWIGGGLYIDALNANLDGNTVISNTAGYGGGLYLGFSPVTLTNTIVTSNRAIIAGSGLYVYAGSSSRLLHTTIARNSGGDGSGVYVTNNWEDYYSTVALTNTILVSQTVGISVTGGNTVTVDAVLWYGTPTTVSQAATATVTVLNQHEGDPAFVDPDAGDYHIGAGSAAIDAGVDAGVDYDIDGEPRPMGAGYDVGADEYDSGCYARLNDGAVYSTVQAAVDASTRPTDVVKVAGHCDGVQVRAGVTQVVYISKTVTIEGGYATTNWATPYPITQPTTLDAQGWGRVLYITGDVSPTVEGLRITGGHTTGDGGGVYIITATATLKDNRVFSNTADSGGGLSLSHSAATLSANIITSNTAALLGGGLHLVYSPATLSDNVVSSNTADFQGGGLYLSDSGATLSGNTVASNTAVFGGGLFADESVNVLFSDNTVSLNTASGGGGLFLYESAATISGNTVASNTADVGAGLGIHHSAVVISGNTITSNTANLAAGGLELHGGSATFRENIATFNTADACGGMGLSDSDAILTNTIVADNHAHTAGSGLCIGGSSFRLLHTTIARNSGGNGSGVYVTDGDTHTSVFLTNTILVSHSVGITVASGNTATLEGTLWGSGTWANTADWGGAGTVVTGTVNLWGDPAFVDPGAGDYHVGAGSVAVDAGVDAGVDYDIDGEPRPMGAGYDIGADELRASLAVTKWAIPSVARAGAPLTYTIGVTNTGDVTLTAIVTDVLPNLVTPTGVFTWTPTIAAPGGVWTEQFTVTVEMGYSGPLTNVVEVTTEEGATGAGSLTVSVVCYKSYLPLVLREFP